MNQGLLIGIGLFAAALLLFWIALPRQGQVVGFLRGRDGMQSFYMMVIILLVFTGLTIAIASTP